MSMRVAAWAAMVIVAAVLAGVAGATAGSLVGGLGSVKPPGASAGPVVPAQFGQFVPTPADRPMPTLTFRRGDGSTVSLEDFRGRVVLLNLWATWCAPCVREMPSLDRLQALMGGDAFEVVALSLDRGGLPQVQPFLERLDVRNLAVYLDPKGEAMRALRPRGLPTTIVIGRDGRELGRVEGELAWDEEAGQSIVRRALAQQPAG